MELVSKSAVQNYLSSDVIASLMEACSGAGDTDLTCQQWLRESAPKRMIFERLYGDLLLETEGRRVLDVGGGLTCFSRTLAERHDYHLLDLMAHDGGADAAQRMRSGTERLAVHVMDWYEFPPGDNYDVVVANDLFPNVDQRLELFLKKFLPVAGEIRLSLTYYPEARFYMTQRVEAEEILYMMAWDGEATARVLAKYGDHIIEPDLGLLSMENASAFPNGRQVCLARLKGHMPEAGITGQKQR